MAERACDETRSRLIGPASSTRFPLAEPRQPGSHAMADGSLQRFLGGSPGTVLVKLIFLSILVGALMAFLEITPWGLIDNIVIFVRRLVGHGVEAIRDVGVWFLYGALVVVPIWLVMRLMGARR
jgi:Family of unknown function (DUF6460)